MVSIDRNATVTVTHGYLLRQLAEEMEYWAGILLVAGDDDLRQNANLVGKRFSDLSADGDKFLVTCSDGIYSLVDHVSDVSRVSDQSFKCITSGKGFNVAIRDNGMTYSWGTSGDSGQLGHGAQNRKIFQPLEIKYQANMQSVSCGESHTIAVDANGHAHAWGDNSERQLNIYTKSKSSMRIMNSMIEELVFNPRIIPWTMKIKLQKVCCGKRFSMAITQDGKLYSWGAGECGQLGNGRCTVRDLPMEVNFPFDNVAISGVACGDGHCIAVDTKNRLFSWGLNQRGQLGLGNFQARNSAQIIASSHKFAKVYATEHCSASIDTEGQLWTWGSTSHDRLLHFDLTKERPYEAAPDLPYILPATREVLHGLNIPTKVSLPGSQGLQFEHFTFSKTKSAVLVRTKLSSISPNKGPKRTFTKLLIHGYGLWDSSNIIVKFSSNIFSIYNPPRAVMGKLQDPFTISCKPPKFSEVGIYTVSISLDGGELFLPDTFELNIYKEVSIAQQSPPIVDLRSPHIEKLTLKIIGSRNLLAAQNNESSHQHDNDNDQCIAVKASLYRINDNGSNSLVKEFPFKGHMISEGFASSVEDPASRPPTSQSESAVLASKSIESEFLVECRDIQIPFDETLPLGLYEMVCAVSFNNQDYSGANTGAKHHHHHGESNTSTICHAFQALEAIPNCYAISELENVRNQVQSHIQTYLKDMSDAGFSIPGTQNTGTLGSEYGSQSGQDINPMEHIPMDQIYSELRNFDRKIVMKAQSLFPANKLPKGAHIKARIDSIKIAPVDQMNNPSPAAVEQVQFISDGIQESLDPLLVYIDSMEMAHFTMTTAFLKVLDEYLEGSMQPPLDRTKQVLSLQWRFYLESAALAGGAATSTSDPAHPSSSSMLLLCEEPLSILLYPASPLSVTPTALRRHPVTEYVTELSEESTNLPAPSMRTISLTCANLVFLPNAAVIRIHYSGAKDKERDVIVVEQRHLRFVEVIGKVPAIHDNEPEGGNSESVENQEEEYVQGYKIEFELPEYEIMMKKWSNVLTTAEGNTETLSSVYLSLSLDGFKIPIETNWGQLHFYSDLSKYTLQTPVPKGGFTANAAITLQLDSICPQLPISVRIRGADEHKAVVVQGQMTQAAGAKPTISFSLPDTAGIAANPPSLHGKEKLYFADISADNGATFDRAPNPLIPLK